MKQKAVDHIEELNRVTKKVCNFFSKEGIFLSESCRFPSYYGFPSYYQIKGKTAKEAQDETLLSVRTLPVENDNRRDLVDTIRSCEKLGRNGLNLDKNQRLKVLSRDFMIEGTTLPIRVRYEIESYRTSTKRVKKGSNASTLYVKQMNLNRIFLGALYSLAVGRDYCMMFSESSVVEREKKGLTLHEAYNNDPHFLSNPKVKRELVGLSVVSYFLSLFDMDNDRNIILSPKKFFDVIDFDKGFWERIPNPREELVNPFAYEIKHKNSENELVPLSYGKLTRHFRKGEIEHLIKEETARVHKNLRGKLKVFHRVIELMSDFDYYNLAVNEIYGEKDIVSYFLKRHFEFRPK